MENGNLKQVVESTTPGTFINKVKGKEVYFAKLQDLEGHVGPEEAASIKEEFFSGMVLKNGVFMNEGTPHMTYERAYVRGKAKGEIIDCHKGL